MVKMVGASHSKAGSTIFLLISVQLIGLLTITPGIVNGTPGKDLFLDGTYTISGIETWRYVTINKTGTLNIPSGATLNCNGVIVRNGSLEMTGGSLTVTGIGSSGDGLITGYALSVNLTRGSIVKVQGTNGNNVMSTSNGGDAVVDLTISAKVNVSGASITLLGMHGYDLPASTSSVTNAWTESNLSGHVAAGGNASFMINAGTSIGIDGASIKAIGGSGGDASKGGSGSSTAKGKGGGYSNGGVVSGFVGSGGNATIIISSPKVTINGTTVQASGGNGGKAGDGGSGGGSSTSSHGKGGGGGGYGGGDGGYNSNGNSANVEGHVGAGGSASIIIEAKRTVMNGSTISAISGDGGNAGVGGSGGSGIDPVGGNDRNGGGGGGGGYGGGGGGNGNGYQGGDGTVKDHVGGGGGSSISLDSSISIHLTNTTISSKGGNGGRAGGGTRGSGGSYSGGPGGGGFGGGGGAGGKHYSPRRGGNGNIMDSVSLGGDSNVYVVSESISLSRSELISSGGEGGSAGNGGNGYISGGSGGGLGGGGAGPYGEGKGGSGYIRGCVSTGGSSTLDIEGKDELRILCSDLKSTGGGGGDGGQGGKVYVGAGGQQYLNNGAGGGGYTGDGGIGNYYGSGKPGKGTVIGPVGDGGNSTLRLNTSGNSYMDSIDIICIGGLGGNAPDSPGEGYSSSRGAGIGRTTSNGSDSNFFEGMPYPKDLWISEDIIFRGENVTITLNGTDIEDKEYELRCHILFGNGNGNWTSLTSKFINISSYGIWMTNLSLGAEIEPGLYSVRAFFEDLDGNWGPSISKNIMVLNNPPMFHLMNSTEKTVLRTRNITVTVNCSDFEDPVDELLCDLQYRPPSGAWVEGLVPRFYNWTWMFSFEPDVNATLGEYDFRTNVTDRDGSFTGWIEHRSWITVENNDPILHNVSINDHLIYRFEEINITVRVFDIEDEVEQLNISLEYRAPSGDWTRIEKTNFDGTSLMFVIMTNATWDTGAYDIRINVTDLDLGTTGWTLFQGNLTILNNIPTLLDLSLPVAYEDEHYVFELTGWDRENSTLAMSLPGYEGWLHLGSSNHSLFGRPGNDDVGIRPVNISVSDGEDTSYWSTFIEVINRNDPPTIMVQDVTHCLEDVLYSVQYQALDIDPTMDILTWEMETNADFLSIGKANGTLWGIPSNDDVGTYWVWIKVCDGRGGCDSTNFTLEVVNVNDAPIILTTALGPVLEDEVTSLQLTAIDIDPTNDTFTWGKSTELDFLYLDKYSGNLVCDPTNDDVGTYILNISVTDENGDTGSTLLELEVVNVNDDPIVDYIEDIVIMEDAPFELTLKAYDIDPSNDVLTWELVHGPAYITLETDSCVLRGTPGNDEVGEHMVQLTVSDGNGGITHLAFNITVQNTNDAPEPRNGNISISMDEDSHDSSLKVKDLFFDVDGNTLSFYAIGTDNISALIIEDIVNIEPIPNWCGKERIILFCSDGTVEVGLEVSVVVRDVNDPPRNVEVIGAKAVYPHGDNQTVMGTAEDDDLPYGDELSFEWVSDLTGPIGVGQTINLSLEPGIHNITLTVTDMEGRSSSTYFILEVLSPPAEKGVSLIAIIVFLLLIVISVLIGVIVLFLLRKMKNRNGGLNDRSPAEGSDEQESKLPVVEAAISDPLSISNTYRDLAIRNNVPLQLFEMFYDRAMQYRKEGKTSESDQILRGYNRQIESLLRSKGVTIQATQKEVSETPTENPSIENTGTDSNQ